MPGSSFYIFAKDGKGGKQTHFRQKSNYGKNGRMLH